MPSQFDTDSITAQTWVRQVEFFEELGSTSDYALEAIQRPEVRLPLLVVAERQTQGRGRDAKTWWSPPGALLFSLAFHATAFSLPPSRRPQVSLAIGLAVAEMLDAQQLGVPCGLKWPNDVYAAGRKIGGILIESPVSPEPVLVAGVGVNVNNSLAAAPPELASTATALCDLTQRSFDRQALLIGILQGLATNLQRLATDLTGVCTDWRKRCLLTGRTVVLRLGSQQMAGVCRGIDDDGALWLDTPQGPARFLSGTVERWGEQGER
jgi:BirA family biotin operon repressor/biotin-[acetyl-CoA-carboxylase] ligase